MVQVFTTKPKYLYLMAYFRNLFASYKAVFVQYSSRLYAIIFLSLVLSIASSEPILSYPPPVEKTAKDSTAITKKIEETVFLLPKIIVPVDSLIFYETLLNYIGQRKPLTEAMLIAIGELKQTAKQSENLSPNNNNTNLASNDPLPARTAAPSTNLVATAPATTSEIGKEISYKRVLQTIAAKQKELQNRYASLKGGDKEKVVDELIFFFNNTIAQDMSAYWLGRNLKNMSEKKELMPAENTRNLVAFMLHDLGYTANYTQLIDLAPRELIALLSEKNTPKYCKDMTELSQFLIKKGKGIYIASFDKYVGVINYNGVNTYLYIADPGNGGKISEIILNDDSRQEFMFPFFNVAAFSYNVELLKKWLSNKSL